LRGLRPAGAANVELVAPRVIAKQGGNMTDEEFRRLKRLAARAHSLLQDDDFKEMLNILKGRAICEWENTPDQDTDWRERAWRDLKAIGRVENYMRELVQQLHLEKRKLGIEA
jgi:hypothetical protein